MLLDPVQRHRHRPVVRLDEILKLDEVRKDLAQGCFLIAAPLMPADGRTKRVSITGEARMIHAMDDAARHDPPRVPDAGRAKRARGQALDF